MARITDLEAIEIEQVNINTDLLHLVDVSSETSIDKKITVAKFHKTAPAATTTENGVVNTSAQSFSGKKTFTGGIVVDDIKTSAGLDLTSFTKFVVVNAVPQVADMEERVLYLYNSVADVYQGYYLIVDGNNRSKGQIGGRSYTGGSGITINNNTAEISNDLAASGGTLGGNTSVQGDLTVTGDIYQQGTSYETHAEKLYTKKDMIITRDGAQSPLATGEMSGIKAEHYNLDGDNGILAFDTTGTARVGDEGDTQPLLTRDEESNLTSGQLLSWDATNKKAVGKSIDLTPTTGSNNPVSSDGAKSYTDNQIAALDVASVGGAGKYISAISEADGKISATETSMDASPTASSTNAVTSGGVKSYVDTAIQNAVGAGSDHNVPRWDSGHLGKDITSYVTDGTLYKRLNGTDGFAPLEDIYTGDYWQMSRAISAPNQDSQYAETGTAWVTIAGIDTLMGNGDSFSEGSNDCLNPASGKHHLVMVPGKGADALEKNHFGRKRMNSSHTTNGGYWSSEMRSATLGDVASSGSTASGATINQQLYAEFGSHLKTLRELVSTQMTSTYENRIHSEKGASSAWEWQSVQSCLMTEVEVYGSVVWSSSGYDTGTGKSRLPLFAFSTMAINNGTSFYWLRGVASASRFAFVGNYGTAGSNSAGYAGICVRPRFVLGA